MPVEDREAHQRRQHVVDNILTLRCPGCSAAVLDYNEADGACIALQCRSRRCRRVFCGYCMEWVSDSEEGAHDNGPAHTHVAEVHHSEGGLFPPLGTFDRVQLERRKRLLHEYLSSLCAVDLQRTLRDCAVDLRALGINEEEFRRTEEEERQWQVVRALWCRH